MSKNLTVVAFIGPKGCGKTTACEELVKNYPGSKILTFAGELKRLCKHAFDLTDAQVYGMEKDSPFMTPKILNEKTFRRVTRGMDEKLHELFPKHAFSWMKIPMNKFPVNAKTFSTPREIMQWVGTEMMHTIYLPFHCEVLAGQINNVGYYFIDDLRFLNEFDFLKEKCPTVKVVRITGRREKEDGEEEHVSESEWKNIKEDYKLDNGKSIEKFRSSVLELFKRITTDVDELVAERPDLNTVVGSILGEADAQLDSNQIRVGKFGFTKQAQ